MTTSSSLSRPLAVHGGPAAVTDSLPSWPIWDDTERIALTEALESGAWGSTSGHRVADFERSFAEAHGPGHASAVSNGTLAISAALAAAGVGHGDEVIVPPYTFIATASAALFIGAIPVFADVHGSNHLIDAAAVEAAVTERTRAVVPVHLAGGIADLDAITSVARRHELVVVEDCAQAVGARWRDRAVGTIGDAGTFSFQSSKNLTAGEGGAVLTTDDRLADRVFSLINVGRRRGGGWYEHTSVGWNLRLTEFQGAVLSAQLPRLAEQQRRREAGAMLLRELLADVDGVTCDAEDERWTAHGRHLFLMRLPAVAGDATLRDAMVRALHAEGVVGASTGYAPLHRNAALLADTADLARRFGRPAPRPDCPVADEVSADTVWLPQHLLLAEPTQLEQIADAISRVVAAGEDVR